MSTQFGLVNLLETGLVGPHFGDSKSSPRIGALRFPNLLHHGFSRRTFGLKHKSVVSRSRRAVEPEHRCSTVLSFRRFDIPWYPSTHVQPLARAPFLRRGAVLLFNSPSKLQTKPPHCKS